MIDFHTEDTEHIIQNKEQRTNWIKQCIQDFNKELGEIEIILCSDEHLLKMNREHLDHDYYTDIITFDYVEGDVISGDLFISIDRVEDNAKKEKVNPEDELDRVIIHGVLHLLGYKDKTPNDKTLMTSKEDFYLSLR